MQASVRAVLANKGNGNGKVASASSTDTVAKAVRHMNELRIGSVVVLEEGRLVGIFTERDVLVRVVAAGKSADATSVADVMTANCIFIRPTTTVDEAMSIMTEKRCRHLPVVENDELLGLISIGDLTRWVVRDQKSQIENLVHYVSG